MCEVIQETKQFSGWKVCYKLSSLLLVNAEKCFAKLEKCGAIQSWYCLTFRCC